MDIDGNRIDDAVLALLLLGLHEGRRAWKSFDRNALDRLHAKGLISDPVRKVKSVMHAVSRDGGSSRKHPLLLFDGLIDQGIDARSHLPTSPVEHPYSVMTRSVNGKEISITANLQGRTIP